jgi:hypothetical protein
MTHLSRDELQRWWERGRPADRDRVVGHLAECDECGRLYAEIIDAQPVDIEGVRALEPAVTRRAYDAFAPARPGPLGWPRHRITLYAAAAALAFAAAVPAIRVALVRWQGDDQTIRGTSLQALEPAGMTGRPIRFRFASPVDAARYAVEIRDAERRLVLTAPAAEPDVTLTPEQAAALVPGRSYTWQAVALTAEGDEIMRSTPLTFSVSGP